MVVDMGPGPAVDIRGGCPPASPAVTHPFFPQLTGFGTVFVIYKSMKKYYVHIWLDDFRAPMVPDGESIFWIKDYDGFVSCVMGLGEKISSCVVHFDHDLGEGKDGYDCAKWLVDWCIKNDYGVPDYDIQSSNPVGRQNIESVFKTYNKTKDD